MKHRSSTFVPKRLNYPTSGLNIPPKEAQIFPYEAKLATFKIMEYRQRLFSYNARRQIISIPETFAVYLDLNPHVTFHLIGWKLNMKAVRSKCCKIFKKKLTSISKNTSIAEIEGGSRDLRLSSMTIANSSLIRSVCERDHKMDICCTDWLRSTFYCYLLSENSDNSDSDCCASAVVTK